MKNKKLYLSILPLVAAVATVPAIAASCEKTEDTKAEKTALKGAINNANTVANNLKDAKAKTALQDAVKTAQATLDKKDATKDDLTKAKAALDAAVTKAKEVKPTPTPEPEEDTKAEKDALSAKIAEAKEVLKKVTKEENKNSLTDAISSAQGTLDKEKNTKAELTKATESLDTAIQNAKASIVTPEDTSAAKSALNESITKAKELSTNIEASKPEAKKILDKSISSVKAVLGKENVTNEELNNAKTQLDAAIATAKEAPVEVAPEIDWTKLTAEVKYVDGTLEAKDVAFDDADEDKVQVILPEGADYTVVKHTASKEADRFIVTYVLSKGEQTHNYNAQILSTEFKGQPISTLKAYGVGVTLDYKDGTNTALNTAFDDAKVKGIQVTKPASTEFTYSNETIVKDEVNDQFVVTYTVSNKDGLSDNFSKTLDKTVFQGISEKDWAKAIETAEGTYKDGSKDLKNTSYEESTKDHVGVNVTDPRFSVKAGSVKVTQDTANEQYKIDYVITAAVGERPATTYLTKDQFKGLSAEQWKAMFDSIIPGYKDGDKTLENTAFSEAKSDKVTAEAPADADFKVVNAVATKVTDKFNIAVLLQTTDGQTKNGNVELNKSEFKGLSLVELTDLAKTVELGYHNVKTGAGLDTTAFADSDAKFVTAKAPENAEFTLNPESVKATLTPNVDYKVKYTINVNGTAFDYTKALEKDKFTGVADSEWAAVTASVSGYSHDGKDFSTEAFSTADPQGLEITLSDSTHFEIVKGSAITSRFPDKFVTQIVIIKKGNTKQVHLISNIETLGSRFKGMAAEEWAKVKKDLEFKFEDGSKTLANTAFEDTDATTDEPHVLVSVKSGSPSDGHFTVTKEGKAVKSENGWTINYKITATSGTPAPETTGTYLLSKDKFQGISKAQWEEWKKTVTAQWVDGNRDQTNTAYDDVTDANHVVLAVTAPEGVKAMVEGTPAKSGDDIVVNYKLHKDALESEQFEIKINKKDFHGISNADWNTLDGKVVFEYRENTPALTFATSQASDVTIKITGVPAEFTNTSANLLVDPQTGAAVVKGSTTYTITYTITTTKDGNTQTRKFVKSDFK